MTEETKHRLMREALQEAERGMSEGEVPIGCVIAVGPDAEIVARGFNRVNALGRKTAHAEIVAFENGGGNPPSLPLDAEDAVLVSTLEPCVMCLGAAMEGGIATVLFGLDAPADRGTGRVRPPESPESKTPVIEGGILAQESRRLLQSWFDANRETEQAEFVGQLLELTENVDDGR
ncbi:nucleoside deaminase [bacterium]|nr:MAG: nucleoside deaminase [bacterium]